MFFMLNQPYSPDYKLDLVMMYYPFAVLLDLIS